MKTRVHTSLHLAEDGNDTTRAVMQNNGGGVNLWVGGVCITADNALLFHELAKVAQLAAQLQESADEKKSSPHSFLISHDAEVALRKAGIDPKGDHCSICMKRRDDAIHAESAKGAV